MGILTLILTHIVLILLFEVSFGYFFLAIALLLGDAFCIYLFVRRIKRRDHFIPKELTKRFSLIVNGVSVILSCILLYSQYFSPISKEIHEEFTQCALYESDFAVYAHYEKLLPIDFKITLITMSDTIDITVDFINRKNACTSEEEVQALGTEMEAAVEELKVKFEDIQSDLKYHAYYAYALIFCVVLYKLLWSWCDLVLFFKMILRVFKKYKSP